MSKPKSEEPPAAPIVLRESCIVNGKLIGPGEPVPFEREEDLPENLRPLVAHDSSELPDPIVRNIYGTAQPPTRYYSFDSGNPSRGGRQAVQGWSLADEAEEFAREPLDPEVEEALAVEHDLRVGRAKAELEHNQMAADAAYEAARREVEGRTVVFHVKRGSVYVRCDKVRLHPGEKCFTREESGEWRFAGVADFEGQPPPQPIIT